MSLLVVGSVALDDVATPSEARKGVLGGSASFFSLTASLLGPVRLVAVVGEDFPQEHVELFRSRGIDLDGLQRVAGRTFHWSGRYLDNMVDRETLDTQLNVFEHFNPELPADYRNSRFVFLANIEPRLQRFVLEQIERPEFVTLDTMNFWLGGEHLVALKGILDRLDALVVNDEEARLLSGEHHLLKAATAIRRMGARRVVVKRGDAGAMLFDEEGIFWAPAYPVERVVDPTGAGDSFAGGMMGFLARTGDTSARNVRRAMIVGSASASFAVEDFSVDRFRSLTTEQLLQRCRAFEDVVRFDAVAW